MTKYLVILTVILIGLFLFMRISFATFNPVVTICHYPPGNPNNPQTITIGLSALGTHLQHGDSIGPCASPTPSPSPSVSPSPLPSPSPSPIVECEEECNEPSPTPTPEATPEAVPSPGPGASGCSQDCHPDYHAPTCNGVYGDRPVITTFSRVTPTDVKIHWVGNNNDYFAVNYGYSADGLVYGIPHLDSSASEVDLNGVEANRNLFVQVTGFRGECSQQSEVIDP